MSSSWGEECGFYCKGNWEPLEILRQGTNVILFMCQKLSLAMMWRSDCIGQRMESERLLEGYCLIIQGIGLNQGGNGGRGGERVRSWIHFRGKVNRAC